MTLKFDMSEINMFPVKEVISGAMSVNPFLIGPKCQSLKKFRIRTDKSPHNIFNEKLKHSTIQT